MAAVINNVPNPEFIPQEVSSVSGSIVSRRRVKQPCNAPGVYSHNGQTARPYVLTFDIWDQENFLDLSSLRYNATFTPAFYRWVNSLSAVSSGAPGASDIAYAPGTGPAVDKSVLSLIARLRIGNSQGFVIEDISQFGIFSNIVDSVSARASALDNAPSVMSASMISPWNEKQDGSHVMDNHQHYNNSFLTESSATFTYDTTNQALASVSVNKTPDKDLQIQFRSSSFLNAMRYLPLFAMRNGLRIELELENPLLAFYHQFGGQKPEFLGSTMGISYNAGTFTGIAKAVDAGTIPVSGEALATDRIAGRTAVAKGDILLGYKQGVLVAYGAVSAVSSVTTTDLSTFTSAGFHACLSSGPTSNILLSALVDELYLIRTPTSYVNGATVGNDYATTFCPAIVSAAGVGNTIVQGASTGATVGGIYWNYALTNNELTLDFVKPSSEVFADYMNRFNSPMGLPYAYTRVLYFSKTLSGTASGTQQINIPVAVRSLKGIVAVITDPLSNTIGNDATIYNFPSKSSFMLRGLSDAQLQIGGQLFPSYKMKFDNVNCLQHVPELKALFAESDGELMIRPSQVYKYARNYQLASGVLGAGKTAALSIASSSAYLAACSSGYHDASNFVLGISTMRKDGDFASGVDCSQAGSVTLNLTFNSTAPGQGLSTSRDRMIHIYALADAIVTFQKDSNGVRY